MKQFFMILAVLALAVVLTACGDKNRNDAGGANGQTRPDTNQSQNAQQDNGTGGSWQNGTDTPTQPGASVGGAAGSQENTQGTGDDALPGDTQDSARMGRGEHRHLPPDAGKRLCPRQRRLPQRRRKHQLVNGRWAQGTVFPRAHLLFRKNGI